MSEEKKEPTLGEILGPDWVLDPVENCYVRRPANRRPLDKEELEEMELEKVIQALFWGVSGNEEEAVLDRLMQFEATAFDYVPSEDGSGEPGCLERPATKEDLRKVFGRGNREKEPRRTPTCADEGGGDA